MSVWWCIVKGSGYSDYPDAFEKAVNRGNFFQGAAWRKDPLHFYVAIAKTLPSISNEKEAKKKFQRIFNPAGTLGGKLRDCRKFEYVKVCPGSSNFYQYVNQ